MCSGFPLGGTHWLPFCFSKRNVDGGDGEPKLSNVTGGATQFDKFLSRANGLKENESTKCWISIRIASNHRCARPADRFAEPRTCLRNFLLWNCSAHQGVLKGKTYLKRTVTFHECRIRLAVGLRRKKPALT